MESGEADDWRELVINHFSEEDEPEKEGAGTVSMKNSDRLIFES